MKTSKKTSRKTTKMMLSEALSNLFGQAEVDLASYEEAMSIGAKAILTLETSTEALLRGILNVGKEEAWIFAEDRNPYTEVKKAVAARAIDTEQKVTLPEGSIAGGKWRAVARESDEPLTRLAGRLAGRLSTLISNDKKKDGSSETSNGSSGKTGKGASSKGDKYARGFDDGFALGRADLVLDLLDAFPKNKEVAAFVKEQKIQAKILAEARERRASAAASAAAKKKAA